jgi:small subunit ribosomal protein S16
MVKIRLRRVGAKKQPSYRVVVTDSRSPRDGRFIEVIGFYNPRTEPETAMIQEDRALYWLSVGAQPTEAVTRLLKNQGTLARFERLKQGESLETLAAEAASATEAAIEAAEAAVETTAEAELPTAIEEEIEEEEEEEEYLDTIDLAAETAETETADD